MAPHDRRGFLRGLATLPLIGGSVSILGTPTAAAVPATPALIDRYVAWIAHEHAAALVAREEAHRPDLVGTGFIETRFTHQAMCWFPKDLAAETAVMTGSVASRAAVILSAAGVALV